MANNNDASSVLKGLLLGVGGRSLKLAKFLKAIPDPFSALAD